MSQRLPPSDNVVLKDTHGESSVKDGMRVLMGQFWSRGVSKERTALDEWAKDIIPTTELRRAPHSGGLPRPQFVETYRVELTERSETAVAVEHLHHETLTGRVTLLFAGHDRIHCHARVLRETVLGVEKDLT